MLIKKAFRFRIYPNQEQRHKLAVQFGHARFVYNWGLGLRKRHYRETGEKPQHKYPGLLSAQPGGFHKEKPGRALARTRGWPFIPPVNPEGFPGFSRKGLSYFDSNNRLKELKDQPEYDWLKQADSQVLQQKLRDLNQAYSNFFEGRANYPRFKSKKSKQSIRYPQRFKIEGKRIYLPKVGWVRTVFHRAIEGRMKNCSVTKTKSGKYFVSIQCEVEIEQPDCQGAEVGIDVGLIDFATLSDGSPPIPIPGYLRQAESRLRRLQRRLSRCQRGSRGYEKVRLLLARQHERVANQRRDFQNKHSKAFVDRYGLICFENLNVAGMLKNHRIAKSISDAAWSEFVRQCSYKGEWYGCLIQKIGRFFPSSKLCSSCGQVHQTLKLSERKWVCVGCGTIHHRDLNASKNILVEGLRLLSHSTVRATGIDAGGENVRPGSVSPSQAVSLKPQVQPEHILAGQPAS